MKRQSRLSIVTIVLLGSSLVAGSALSHFEHTASLQQQVEGHCDELQVVFVVDQSGSMSEEIDNVPPSDPEGLRFYGPAKAVETLSSLRHQAYQNATMRVALVNFGTKPRLGMPWTDLNATTEIEHQELQEDMKPFFAPISSMGNTHVLAAFQQASSLFNQASPQVGACPTRAVIFLTDGQPYVDTEDFVWTDYMTETIDYVGDYMAPPEHQIYVVGIDKANTYWDRVKPYWDKVTGDPAKVVKADDETHMGSLVIGIVEELARSLRPAPEGAEATMECIEGGSLSVPPFIQQIQLTLIKPSPDLHLVVLDESGRQLDPSRSDVSVALEGYDEPIETLTVSKPQPGIWTVQTKLPQDAEERCQIRMLSFSAVGKLASPDASVPLMQFKRAPVVLQVVDASGDALPDYGDPMYELKMDVSLVGPSGDSQPITLDAGPGYEYSGQTIPLESGANSLQVKAASHNPDGSEYVVFDKSIATLQVMPVRFVMTEGPSGVVPQHVNVPLKFAVVDTSQQLVQVDLSPTVSATLTSQNETRPLTMTVGQDGTYGATFRPEQPGRYVLAYQATVGTPSGSMGLAKDQITFDVFPTKLVRAKIVIPPSDHFVATDPLLRPTGLPLEVQMVDEDGKEIGPGEVGAANPMSVFQIKVLDENENDRSAELRLISTGKPGLFRLDSNKLGPGRYDIKIMPATTLGRDYVWAEESWSKTVEGDINKLFFVVVGAVLAVLSSGGGWIWAVRKARQHPLSGYIEVFQEIPDMDGETYQKTALRRDLPKRNRAVITPSQGIAGVIERVFRSTLAKGSPIKRIVVICSTEADSKAKRARAEVEFKDGSKLPATLGPAMPATPLKLGYFIEKGPQKLSAPSGAGELPDTFDMPDRRR